MAESNRKNVAWGMAKVEFLPLIPDIKALLALAWPKKAIFNKLAEEQKITMGYVVVSQAWQCYGTGSHVISRRAPTCLSSVAPQVAKS